MTTIPFVDEEAAHYGKIVLLADAKAVNMEAWVNNLREEANIRMDWKYMGGRAVLSCIGNEAAREKVATTAWQFREGFHVRIMEFYEGFQLPP